MNLLILAQSLKELTVNKQEQQTGRKRTFLVWFLFEMQRILQS
jgi:hypothetical protein